MTQKTVFIESEGDAWFERNPKEASSQVSLMLTALRSMQIAPKSILEIGCGGGAPLSVLQKAFGAKCVGIDPSSKAVEYGSTKYPGILFLQGTADDLQFEDESFDLVVAGFCLYLTDPRDHFRIAWQIDRVLRDKGSIVIKDFLAPSPYKNSYAHQPNLYSYKMDWSNMLTWHPSYSLLSRTYIEHGADLMFAPDERVGIDIIRKDAAVAFPGRPETFHA